MVPVILVLYNPKINKQKIGYNVNCTDLSHYFELCGSLSNLFSPQVSGSVKPVTVVPPQSLGDGKYCTLCAEKAASELGKLTEKIIELKRM